MAKVESCADVRINETERLKRNFRKLLEWILDDPLEWDKLSWREQSVEGIVDTLFLWFQNRSHFEHENPSHLFPAINTPRMLGATTRQNSEVIYEGRGNTSQSTPKPSHSGTEMSLMSQRLGQKLPSLFPSGIPASMLSALGRTQNDVPVQNIVNRYYGRK